MHHRLRWVARLSLVMTVLILGAGCGGSSNTRFPAGRYPFDEKSGDMSNFTELAADAYLIPVDESQAELDTLVFHGSMNVPACGYQVIVEIAAYSHGHLVWQQADRQKVVMARALCCRKKQVSSQRRR